MQPIDPHTLFSIFEQGDEEVYKENGVEETLNNPYVLMGMVIRGIDNYHIMDMMYTKRYPEQYDQVKGTIKYKFFNKLCGYLERIDTNKFENIYKIGESFETEQIFLGLNKLLEYFESIEYYEKCAIVKKYQDLLLENLPYRLDIR